IDEGIIGQSLTHADADYRVTDYYTSEDSGTEYKNIVLNGIVRGSDNTILSGTGSFDAEAWDDAVDMSVVNHAEGSSDYIPEGTYIHEGPFSTFKLTDNPENAVSGFSQGDMLTINGNQHEILDVSTKLFTGEKTVKLSGVVMDSGGVPLNSGDTLDGIAYNDQNISLEAKEIGYVEAETRVRVTTKTTQFVVSEAMEDELNVVLGEFNSMSERGVAELTVFGNTYRIVSIEQVGEQFNNRDIDNDEENAQGGNDYLLVVEGIVVNNEGEEFSANQVVQGGTDPFTISIGSNDDHTYSDKKDRLYTASVNRGEDLEDRLGLNIVDNYLKINGDRYKVTKTESDSSGIVLTLSGRVTDTSGNPITGGVSVSDIIHEGVQASANLGPFGVDVVGNGSLDATLNSLESRGKYTVGDVIEHARHLSLFTDMFNIGDTSFELSGNYDFEIIPEGFGSGLMSEGTESAVFKVSDFSLTDLGDLDFTASFENLKNTISDLLDTGFSTDDIAETISNVLNNLKDMAGEELFNKKLPIINKSINDIVGVVEDVVSTIQEFSENPGDTLQELNEMLKEKLGVKNDMVSIYFEDVPSEEGSDETDTMLKFEIDYMKYFEEAVGLDFGKDLGFDFPGVDDGDDNISGAADLSVSGEISLNVDFGINLTDKSVTIYDTTTVDVNDFAIEGKDLEFQLVAGGVGITVQPVANRDSYITVNNAEASIFLEEDYVFAPFADNNPEEEDSDDEGSEDENPEDEGSEDDSINLGTSFSGYIGGQLPVFFPTDTRYVGSLSLGTWDDNNTPQNKTDDSLSVSPQGGDGESGYIEDFRQFAEFKVWKGVDEADNESDHNVAEAFGPDGTYPTEDSDEDNPEQDTGINNDLVLDIKDFRTGIDFNMKNLDLFKKLELAVDGLDLFVSAINANIDFSELSDVPVIGGAMQNMNGFLDGFRYDFLGKLREFVFEGGDLNAKSVGNFLLNILGPDGFEGFDGLDLLPDLDALEDIGDMAFDIWGEGGITMPELAGDWDNAWNQLSIDGLNLPGVHFTTNITHGADYNDQYAEWLFTIGDVYSLGTDLGFDIGVPGFGFESNGNLSVNLHWAL
ncbi:MAG: hypothetical protein ACOCSE_05125, partial [Chitinivibrionales bacterium]